MLLTKHSLKPQYCSHIITAFTQYFNSSAYLDKLSLLDQLSLLDELSPLDKPTCSTANRLNLRRGTGLFENIALDWVSLDYLAN